MRKVILQEFVSLDGLAAGGNDDVGFIPASVQGDQCFGREQLALIDAIDAILLGRVTYRMFADYWPNVTEGDDRAFAGKLNSIAKVVFSRTLDRAPWGAWEEARVVPTSLVDEVARLKRQGGKGMLVWGSLSLAQSLMAERLVDEYRLVLCPVALGRGRPLFDGTIGPVTMELADAKTMDRGALSLTYTPGRAQA